MKLELLQIPVINHHLMVNAHRYNVFEHSQEPRRVRTQLEQATAQRHIRLPTEQGDIKALDRFESTGFMIAEGAMKKLLRAISPSLSSQ